MLSREQDFENRIVAPEMEEMDRENELSLRPRTLDEYIGQTKAKENMAIYIEAAKRRGKEKMSAQAVGNAIGSNPISIIVPCHRVVGANGSLTGYNGGIKYKTALLKLEGSYSECGIRNPECGIT